MWVWPALTAGQGQVAPHGPVEGGEGPDRGPGPLRPSPKCARVPDACLGRVLHRETQTSTHGGRGDGRHRTAPGAGKGSPADPTRPAHPHPPLLALPLSPAPASAPLLGPVWRTRGHPPLASSASLSLPPASNTLPLALWAPLSGKTLVVQVPLPPGVSLSVAFANKPLFFPKSFLLSFLAPVPPGPLFLSPPAPAPSPAGPQRPGRAVGCSPHVPRGRWGLWPEPIRLPSGSRPDTWRHLKMVLAPAVGGGAVGG